MTVNDLVQALLREDQRMLVCVDGYEQGCAEDVKVKVVTVRLNGNGDEDGIYGRHERLQLNDDDGSGTQVVLIGEDRWEDTGQ